MKGSYRTDNLVDGCRDPPLSGTVYVVVSRIEVTPEVTPSRTE
jgi:hypothetical protein